MFTRRELQILEACRAGASTPEIAKRLGVTVGTVKQIRARAYRKLGVTPRQRQLAQEQHRSAAGISRRRIA